MKTLNNYEETTNALARLIWITPEAEKLLMYIARVSSPNQNSGKAGLIRYLAEHKHWSPFEAIGMAVEVNTSRAISAQLLRHRSFTFQEFSQRYAAVDSSGVVIYAARRQDDKNRQNSIDDISDEIKEEWVNRQHANWRNAFEHYQWAVDNGIAKESARMVLPMQTATKIYVVGNVRSFLHYIIARTDPSTQKEHRDIALTIKDIFVDNLPLVSQALGWEKNNE